MTVILVDARNELCSIPVLRAAAAIRDLPSGKQIELVATDEAANADVPAWASDMGHLLVETFEEGDELHFVIEKG